MFLFALAGCVQGNVEVVGTLLSSDEPTPPAELHVFRHTLSDLHGHSERLVVRPEMTQVLEETLEAPWAGGDNLSSFGTRRGPQGDDYWSSSENDGVTSYFCEWVREGEGERESSWLVQANEAHQLVFLNTAYRRFIYEYDELGRLLYERNYLVRGFDEMGEARAPEIVDTTYSYEGASSLHSERHSTILMEPNWAFWIPVPDDEVYTFDESGRWVERHSTSWRGTIVRDVREYSDEGLLMRHERIGQLPYISTYTYDERGRNVETVVDHYNSFRGTAVTTYTYGEWDTPLTKTEDGEWFERRNVWTWTYDRFGRVLSEELCEEYQECVMLERYERAYDDLGRIVFENRWNEFGWLAHEELLDLGPLSGVDLLALDPSPVSPPDGLLPPWEGLPEEETP